MKPILNTDRRYVLRVASLVLVIAVLTITSARLRADTGTCNGSSVTLPFTDVNAGNTFFCSIAEAFFAGLSNGTTATTYSPAANVTREQMAAFVTRTLDQSLRRGSQRAAMKRFWLNNGAGFGFTDVGDNPRLCEYDGADVWVANAGDDTVSRVRASDGEVLQTWRNTFQAFGVLVVNHDIYVTGKTTPPKVYWINAQSVLATAITISNTVGDEPEGIAFDGTFVWTANASGSVSRIHANLHTTTTFTAGFSSPRGMLYDGANIWVTDFGDDQLKKLDNTGNILQTVPVGDGPRFPVYDGINIWVPNQLASTISVVRASTGQVLATISSAAIVDTPLSAAFDGERIFVVGNKGDAAIFKAADLSLIATRSLNAVSALGTCSDGIRFFFTQPGSSRLVAF